MADSGLTTYILGCGIIDLQVAGKRLFRKPSFSISVASGIFLDFLLDVTLICLHDSKSILCPHESDRQKNVINTCMSRWNTDGVVCLFLIFNFYSILSFLLILFYWFLPCPFITSTTFDVIDFLI